MVKRDLKVVVYKEDGVFVAQCLNVNVASEGDTEEAAWANIREALELYFEEDSTEVVPVDHVRVAKLTLTSA